MSKKPRVSVLMAVYNSQTTLRESVESILCQSFGDFEFIICNDGSQDTTCQVLKEYADRDARIVVIENKVNRGLPYSLNRCIEIAEGEYLARMDGDDLAMPERFQMQVDFLDRHPEIAICGTAIKYFDANGVWGELYPPANPDKKAFLRGSPFAHPTVMLRTEIIRRFGGYSEDPSVGQAEDAELFMRLYAGGQRGVNLPTPMLLYREDMKAIKRRTIKRSWYEAQVRWRGYSNLGLMPQGVLWALKPLLVGIIPRSMYQRIRKRRFLGATDLPRDCRTN